MLEEVKKILESNGVFRDNRNIIAQQICQLFEPKETVKLPQVVGRGGEANDESETDYNIGDKGKTTGCKSYGTMPKHESRLLTDEELQELSSRLITVIDKWHGGVLCTGTDYSKISAENEIHCIYMNEIFPKVLAKTASIYVEHIAHLIDDVIKLEKELKQKDAECQKQLADCIFMQKAKCQARVDGIFGEIDEYFKYVTKQKPPIVITDFWETEIWWQSLKKQEETFICPWCGKTKPISVRCSKGYCLACSGKDF